jgi:hypothetical protein
VKSFAGWVLALLVVIGTGVGIEAGAGAHVATTHQPANNAPSSRASRYLVSSVAGVIDQAAINEATWAGDPSVSSVTWVRSTRGAVNAALGEAPGPNASNALYVIELSGNFTLNVSVPFGDSAPVCDELVAALSAATYATVEYECTINKPAPDLGILGTPETDSLSGVTAGPLP